MASALKDKVVFITGASAGIGKALVALAAQQGAHVILACRNEQKTNTLISEIKAEYGNDLRLGFLSVDLYSFDSMKKAVEEFKSRNLPIHYLFLNAGVNNGRGAATKDGFNTLIQANYLSNFYLVHELLPILEASAPSKVIITSSGMGQGVSLEKFNKFFDIAKLKEGQTGETVYGDFSMFTVNDIYCVSKAMVNSFVRVLAPKIESKGVQITAVHPGVISTELTRDFPWIVQLIAKWFFLNAIEGAKPLLHVATDPALDAKTGVYFNRFTEEAMTGVSTNDEVAAKLWNASEEWTGVKYEF